MMHHKQGDRPSSAPFMVHLTDVDDYAWPVIPATGYQQSMAGRSELRPDCSGPIGFAVPGVKPRYRVAVRAVQMPDDTP